METHAAIHHCDRTGVMGDTILVANSGDTNISYVDLNAGASGSGLEVFRYDLPNIIAFTMTTTTSGTSGLPIQVATKYDFSDRPHTLPRLVPRQARTHGRDPGLFDYSDRWAISALREP